MNIFYTNSEGAVSIITPTQEALDLFTLDEIAKGISVSEFRDGKINKILN